MDGRKKNGGARKGAGRKPRSDERKVVEALEPTAPSALNKLKQAVELGEPWAIKLFFQYYYGMPKQIIEQVGDKQKIEIEIIE